MEINRCHGCMGEIGDYPCPHCGYDPRKAGARDYALRPGCIVNGKYLLGRVLGQGGFGITYIGWDIALERKVAIKEYYPSGQVVRQDGLSLQWYDTQQAREARENGLEFFLKEARKMAKLEEIPRVVKVRELFQENETAYIVMDFVEGQTLKSILMKNGPMPWERAKDIFLPAMEAMEKVHQAGLVHRDLSPDNLMITPDGGVMILDLGAAKDLRINSGASSMQVAKGGFSPIEQYIQRGGSGTWTDVYSMAASVYYTLTGKLPPNAVDRLNEDTIRWDYPGLMTLSAPALNALKKAMVVQAKKRTQTMGELYAGIADQPHGTSHFAERRKKPWRILLPVGAALACALIAAAFLGKPAALPEEPVTVARQETKASIPEESREQTEEEIRYQQAAQWEMEDDLARAAIAFCKLGDYRDARKRSFAIWDLIAERNTLSAGGLNTMAVRNDGTVLVAGYVSYGEGSVTDWQDVIAINATETNVLGLQVDGTVVALGDNQYGQCDVSGWRDIVQISGTQEHTVGLRADGTVVATGRNQFGQCEVSGWTDIVAVSTSWFHADRDTAHTVGLRLDGTVVIAGENTGNWWNEASRWQDIVEVKTGGHHIVGLKSDGTAVAVGSNQDDWSILPSRYAVSEWTDVVHLEAYSRSTIGLRSDGTMVAVGNNQIYHDLSVKDWTDISAFCNGVTHTVGLKKDGTVVAAGWDRYGCCDVSEWENIVVIDAGFAQTVGLRSDGTLVAVGDNTYKQCRIGDWTDIKLPTKKGRDTTS